MKLSIMRLKQYAFFLTHSTTKTHEVKTEKITRKITKHNMPKTTSKTSAVTAKSTKSKRKVKKSGNLAVDLENQENFEAVTEQLPSEVSNNKPKLKNIFST